MTDQRQGGASVKDGEDARFEAGSKAARPDASGAKGGSAKSGPAKSGPAKSGGAKTGSGKTGPKGDAVAAPKPAEPAPGGGAAEPPAPRPTQPAGRGAIQKAPQRGGRPGPARAAQRSRPPNRISARFRFRHFLLAASFLICVVGPAIFANWYLHTTAADQYASNLAFTIQSDDGAAVSVLDSFFGGGGAGGSSADDAEVLYGFIRSQNMVEKLQGDLDLRAMYNKPTEDWFFRLGDDPSIEALVDYWESMCIVSYSNGIVEVEVRAFDPDDAQRIARDVLAESTAQINRMSLEAREDALRDARDYLTEKEDLWRQAQLAVTTFRSEEAMLDPTIESPALLQRISDLESQLDREMLRLDDLRQFAPSGDSRVAVVERRIDTLNTRIAEERAKLSASDTSSGGVSAGTIGRFEALETESEIARTAYEGALASYENARIEARRKQRYLSPHIAPTRSEAPQYPERYFLGGLVTVFLLLGWAVLVMLGYNIRDRR